jgi:hypothetical protein
VVVLGGFRHVLGDGDLDEVEERGACHSQEEDQHQVGIIADLEKNNMRISLFVGFTRFLYRYLFEREV